MSRLFDERKSKSEKKDTPRATAGRLVMDVFRKRKAYTPDSAVKVDAFKDLPLSNEVIAYTLANLYEGNLVIKTEDDCYYFLEENYKKFERKTIFQFYLLFALPIIVLLFILFVTNGWKITIFN